MNSLKKFLIWICSEKATLKKEKEIYLDKLMIPIIKLQMMKMMNRM